MKKEGNNVSSKEKKFIGAKAKEFYYNKIKKISQKLQDLKQVSNLTKKSNKNIKKVFAAILAGISMVTPISGATSEVKINTQSNTKVGSQNDSNTYKVDSQNDSNTYKVDSNLTFNARATADESTEIQKYKKCKIISSYGLNIRSSESADNDSNKLAILNTGDTIYVEEDSINEKDGILWGKIIYNIEKESGIYETGYAAVNEKYVSTNSSNESDIYIINNQLVYETQQVNTFDESDGLNLRKGPSTNNDIIASIPNGSIITVLDESSIEYDENSNEVRIWVKILYSDPENDSEILTGWVASEYLQEIEKSNLEDSLVLENSQIEITKVELEALNNYVHSWENQPLYSYMHNNSGNLTINSKYVKGYITEDGSEYYCRGDAGIENGALNYEFGVMINQNGIPNEQTVKYFKELGYDVTQNEYLKEGVSTIHVSIVDQVTELYLIDTLKTIDQCMSKKGITLSKNEILGLGGICYQFGRGSDFINNFLDEYMEYGNTDEFKENFKTTRGTYIFKFVNGGTRGEYGRADANWKLFHEGVFVMGADTPELIYLDDLNNENNEIENNTYINDDYELDR